jgi:hypothetical protein
MRNGGRNLTVCAMTAAVALYRYDLTSPTYGLTGFGSRPAPKPAMWLLERRPRRGGILFSFPISKQNSDLCSCSVSMVPIYWRRN